jgi:hypothetical protein
MIKIEKENLIDKLVSSYLINKVPMEEVMIFGIQNEENQDKDVINDVIGILYKQKDLYLMEGTTNPGKYYTTNPMNAKGCFHLGYGYQSKIWKVGIHSNYEALVNQKGCGSVTGWRDKDKDHRLSDNIDIVDAGVFNVDLHRMSVEDRETIWKYSAGCQTILHYQDFLLLMSMIKGSDMYRKIKATTYFSYYLFKKQEMEELYNEVYK